MLTNIVTDFEQLAFAITTAAESFEQEVERPSASQSTGPHSPYHFVLLWLMERGILIQDVGHACDQQGYDKVQLMNFKELSSGLQQQLLDGMQEFHLSKLLAQMRAEVTS